MREKQNTTSRALRSNYRNDAVKGTYKWWHKKLEDDVYNLGMSYEKVKEKYSYGSYKPNWLSTKYWKKRFDAGYSYWEAKRKADKDSGTYTGSYTVNENPNTKASNTTMYLIYGLIAVLAIFIIWGIVKKRKK